RPDDFVILVMGTSGAGKTTFIQNFAKDQLDVGVGLESCTQSIQICEGKLSSTQNIMLVDMPGLDDSARSDTDVLLEISDWLQTAYQERISISGIVYLHRISDARIGISDTKNLRMLQKLCGNSMLDRVVFATTFWDKILMEHGAEREKELASREDFLHPMIRRGTTLTRHIGGRESACRIVELLTNTNTRCTLDIQIDMVERGLLKSDSAWKRNANGNPSAADYAAIGSVG
ncbi:hypothetical protein L207DRAFT_446310, partial [Hyaloscypha variabilis F]